MRNEAVRAGWGVCSQRLGTLALLVSVLAIASGCATHQSDYSDHEAFLNENEGRFTKTGAYVGLGYTAGMEDFSLAGVSADDANGYHLRFGYRGSRYFGIGASWEQLNTFDVSPDTNNGGVADGYDARVLAVDTRIYPLGFLEGNAARIQPFAQIGLGVIWVGADSPADTGPFGGGTGGPSDTEYSSVLRFGGGLEAYLTENIYLNGEYLLVKPLANRLDDFEFQELNLGFGFRF
ncbi:MAG: porin family protein [Planctomycetota bacterium]